MLRRLAVVGGRRATARPLSALPRSDDDDAPFCSSTAEQPHGAYPRLFSPLTLPCGLEIRNRSLMGSMHTGLEEHRGLKEMAAFYAERAKGGAGLIVTGGVAPNREGWVLPLAGKMSTVAEAEEHKVVTDAVHDHGGKIALQILHAGRYAYHPFAVAPSKKKAPINVVTPRALSEKDVERTISDFARTAALARSCGYDGVEIMGSEGYLINEFLAERTNSRSDRYGGSFENRSRLALDVVQAVRQAAGPDFAVVFRLSMLELVEKGMAFDEVVELAHLLDASGVDILNTGIGWHEARVPTIATCVPRGAFAFATTNLRETLLAKYERAPLMCATNRINTAQTCEDILEKGADVVSMARPFLADSQIIEKAFHGREDETNTCIACNQACLDHTFRLMPVSCLVNPRAGHETSLELTRTATPLRVAVVGAGPAGLSAACALGERGHRVTLFEQAERVGGQFLLAAAVPGKEEFWETLRYFRTMLDVFHVDVRLNTYVDASSVKEFDRVVVATGVRPRVVEGLASSENVRVHSYADVLSGASKVGPRVAVVGAGGIGFDVSEFLTHLPGNDFYGEWGVDTSPRGSGLVEPSQAPPPRTVYLLQRKATPLGAGLGKTTGWIHRKALRQARRAEIEISRHFSRHRSRWREFRRTG
jgi:2,4-dienoyl-CoA reductase (NADPH2)